MPLMQPTSKSTKLLLPIIAWISVLFVSQLPNIVIVELGGTLPAWLFWGKVGFIGLCLIISMCWKLIQPLRLFFMVVLAVNGLEWGAARLFAGLKYQTWFAGANSFVQEVGSVQIPRAAASLGLVLVMFFLLRNFAAFFLTKGKLNAQAKPIPFILTRPPSWRILGPAIAGAMSLGLVVFVFAFGNLPSVQSLKGVLPLLPFILLFAANNAFGEEMLYRAPWLAALESPVGHTQALLMTAVYFGIGHFYGVPYGVLGVVMAFIPGWLMGKAMLETRGFFWAWFIHFWMDFVIFFSMALGSVRPGG